jgi:hypothetical protein
MRGISCFLVLAGVVAAQGNLTVQTSQTPPSPSATTDITTEEPLFSIAGYGKPTCQAVTVTITSKVPGPKETKTKTATITSTCYETKTVHDTKTLTSTTTCTEVSFLFLTL